MNDSFLEGARFFVQGLNLIFQRGLKRYIIVPMIVNMILLCAVCIGLGLYLYHRFSAMIYQCPEWLIFFLGGLFWVLLGVLSFLLSTWVFILLTNLIAAPFYGLLAEKAARWLRFQSNQAGSVTAYYTPALEPNTTSIKSLLLTVPHAFLRELRKLLYMTPKLVVYLLLFLFPFTWPLIPIMGWIIFSWILAIQYIDYQADNERVSFNDMMRLLKIRPMTVFGFGSAISLVLLIPGANLLVPAAAVAGGTVFWLSIRKEMV